MSKKFRILSIDGGGIRGVIPAMLMAEIEKRTGRPIAELFDLIAGTSTGGILALAAVKPAGEGIKRKPQYSAQDAVGLYETEGPRIFFRSPWRTIRTLGGVVDEKYPTDKIEAVLEEYFGGTLLSEALAEVIIPAYETETRDPIFFKSRKAQTDPKEDFLMWHVARATSAAPSYFEPAQIKTQGRVLSLVDGGVIANTPAMCALAEAKKHHPGANDILLVSLGTGDPTRPISYEAAKGWGIVEWLVPLFSLFFDGMSDSVDYQLTQLLPPGPDGYRRYYRFQTHLVEGNDNIDDASRTNIRVLKMVAQDMINAKLAILDELCAQLIDSL